MWLFAVELQQMFENDSKTLLDFDPQDLDVVPFSSQPAAACKLSSPRGSGSGGYVENVFIHASQQLYGITPESLVYTPGRSAEEKCCLLNLR